jgi:hypothetical protein
MSGYPRPVLFHRVCAGRVPAAVDAALKLKLKLQLVKVEVKGRAPPFVCVRVRKVEGGGTGGGRREEGRA